MHITCLHKYISWVRKEEQSSDGDVCWCRSSTCSYISFHISAYIAQAMICVSEGTFPEFFHMAWSSISCVSIHQSKKESCQELLQRGVLCVQDNRSLTVRVIIKTIHTKHISAQCNHWFKELGLAPFTSPMAPVPIDMWFGKCSNRCVEFTCSYVMWISDMHIYYTKYSINTKDPATGWSFCRMQKYLKVTMKTHWWVANQHTNSKTLRE